MNKRQIERIEKMEERYDSVSAAVTKLSLALDEYNGVLKDLRKLEKYYSSELWLHDYEDDEAGRIPTNLKRAVLSQDSLYDLLSDIEELKKKAHKL